MSSISPISALTTPASTGTSSSTGTNSLADPNTFLQLLVAELKYQDPMNPADPNQYLAQTAQFAMVQKINDLDTQMASMLKASQEAAGSSLIGRQVTGTTAAGDPVTGTVTGIQTSASGVDVLVGGQDVPIADVTAITGASASPPSSPPAGTGSAQPPSTPTDPSTSQPGSTPTQPA